MLERKDFLGLCLITSLFLIGCYWSETQGIGLKDGTLKPCPERPNCVSSREEGERPIEPLEYIESTGETRERVLSFFGDQYDASVQSKSDTYVHLTVSTTLGFVDDLQFRLVPEERIVHVRSASRVGYDDLGANRARIEALRKNLKVDDS
jgi:uncharacterized protein (DUF1499 family)